MQEIWKDIEGYEGLYQVSSMGRVRRLHSTVVRSDGTTVTYREHVMRPCGRPYHHVMLSKENRVTQRRIHRLVAETFLPNPDGLRDVDHINGIKTDNRLCNLRWCSHRDNIIHAEESGLMRHKGYHDWPEEVRRQYSSIRRKPIVRSDGKRYACADDAASDLGVTRAAISHVLRGLNRSCKGFGFVYA